MWSSAVVVLEPGAEHTPAVHGVRVGGGVNPFAQHGLDESLCLAVGAGPIGPGAQVLDLELGDGSGMGVRTCRQDRCRS